MATGKGKVILVAGKNGQLARALTGLAAHRSVPLIAVGRPNLDIEVSGSRSSPLQELCSHG